MTRVRLPDRRFAETVALEHGGARFMVTIGRTARRGVHPWRAQRLQSRRAARRRLCCDFLLIQHGVEPRDLAISMGRLGSAEPASVIGAVVNLLAASAARYHAAEDASA